MTTTGNIENAFSEQVVMYLKSTPQAIAVLFFAMITGHLWVYIITAYIRKKTKGDKLLNSILGRMALGLVWFTVILIPVYLVKYGIGFFEYIKVIDIVK